jgi:hypothetical protein
MEEYTPEKHHILAKSINRGMPIEFRRMTYHKHGEK